MKKDIKSMLPEELEAVFLRMGERKFRAKQVFRWLSNRAKSFEEMTNLPKSLRLKLDEEYYIIPPVPLRKQVSRIDGTVKYLWELRDGNAVESVIMKYRYGNTVCISSQVGCRMGCAFCASTLGGLARDLEPSEMLDQVLFSEEDSGEPVTNIVMMGIGEPLDNFDNVMRFLSLITHPDGRNIGGRHITLSTCGLAEIIDKLGNYNLQLTLSVSLHAPDDETRRRIMPVNRVCGVDELLEACLRYGERTGRRVSFEYAMIDGVNDTPRHARLLAEKMRRLGGHVNLIPLNRVEERELTGSPAAAVKAFEKILSDSGVNVTLRRKLGSDIDASCGQLRQKSAAETLEKRD